MPEAPFDPEELNPILQTIPQALVAYTPAHFRRIVCVAQQSLAHGDGRLEYRIGSPEYPDEGTRRPSPELHDAMYALFRLYTSKKLGFPSIEVTMEAKPDGGYGVELNMLDPGAMPPTEDAEDRKWSATYEAREAFFAQHFGPLPGDLQTLMNLSGVWPGGGLFAIVAERLGGKGVCTTFGLSNVDMPASTRSKGAEQRAVDGSVQFSHRLEARTPRWAPPEAAGYGYELIVLTPRPEPWPLGPLSWLVQIEIQDDVGMHERVAEVGGVTLESVGIGGGRKADFLVAPAQPPLPGSAQLPNGTMQLLVATRITRDEMNFARANGPPALLERLVASGVGQTSDLERRSILEKG
jgi:hypothetical protein